MDALRKQFNEILAENDLTASHVEVLRQAHNKVMETLSLMCAGNVITQELVDVGLEAQARGLSKYLEGVKKMTEEQAVMFMMTLP